MRARWTRLPGPVQEVAWALATGVLALLAAAIVLKLWDASLHVPFQYGGDNVWNLEAVEGLVHHGWLYTNPDVGRPFGQELFDYAGTFGDNGQFLIIKAMSILSKDPAALVNMYFLLTFVLDGGVAYLVLRALGVSRLAATGAGVLFATIPDHFLRSESHLFISGYWVLALGGYLLITFLSGTPMFARRPRAPRWRAWLSARTLTTLCIAIVVGGCDLYYALFTVILLALAGLAVLVTRGGWRRFLAAVVTAVFVLGTLGVNLMPSIVYGHEHGSDPAVGKRLASESYTYATSLTQYLMPVSDHRFGPARRLTARFDATHPTTEAITASVGFVSAVGLLFLLAVLIAPALLRGGTERWSRFRPAAGAAGLAVLVSSIGGFSLLFALLVTPGLRAWNRMSPMVALAALLGLSLAFDGWRARGGRRRDSPVLAALAIGAVVVFGVWDQTTPGIQYPYKATAALWRSDAGWFHQIAQRLGSGASVAQLPYLAFPEGGGIVNEADYDDFRGYLHAPQLKWSYGAMKGRKADLWQQDVLAARPIADALPYLAGAGFSAVYVDQAGYADGGVAVVRALRNATGVQPWPSFTGREVVFDLRPYARRMRSRLGPAGWAAARAIALAPTEITPVAPSTVSVSATELVLLGPPGSGSLHVDNGGTKPRRVRLSGIAQGDHAPVTMLVQGPNGFRGRISAPAEGRPFQLTLVVPPGSSNLRLRRVSRTPADAHLRSFRVDDLALAAP